MPEGREEEGTGRDHLRLPHKGRHESKLHTDRQSHVSQNAAIKTAYRHRGTAEVAHKEGA